MHPTAHRVDHIRVRSNGRRWVPSWIRREVHPSKYGKPAKYLYTRRRRVQLAARVALGLVSLLVILALFA